MRNFIKEIPSGLNMVKIPFIGRKKNEKKENLPFFRGISGIEPSRGVNTAHRNPLVVKAAAGLSDVFGDTNKLRSDSNYENEFELFDAMLSLDPELNGAIRAVSLTGNKYMIDWKNSKNARIREAIKLLVEETIDFDDFLINAMRNLMVYGNDINKIVGRGGVGVEQIQSLPVSQTTITDGRPSSQAADRTNPMIEPTTYILREALSTEQSFSADEILHVKIDYRSNWYLDPKNRWSYGIWGASRFSSLKSAIRAKYNTINNRIALEESMTKQFITIKSEAIAHITDPDEQRDRLVFIMDEIIATLESLRGDQIPIFPDYVEIHHTDTRNTIPDNTSFLDMVNGDIAAVLQVPRVASGQERGSTFAATYNANVWAVGAIARLQAIVTQGVQQLFSKHLELIGIEHRLSDLPKLTFEPIDEEAPIERMRRAKLGYEGGIITLNQALELIGEPNIGEEGDIRQTDESSSGDMGDLPRPNSQPGNETEPEELPEETPDEQ